MKLHLDIKNRRFVKSAASNVALSTLVLKRRDQVPVELVFVENGTAITPPEGTTASIGLKARFSDSNFLAFAAPGTELLDLYTEPVEVAFFSNPASLPALLEVAWGTPGTALRTATLQVELQNAVITGDEGTPAAMPDGKATQAQAEAGTDNEQWMTPLRTAQAIAQLAPPPTWDSVLDKPSTFPPSSHGHAISDITELETALDSKIPYGTALGGASVPFADGALSLRNFEDPGEVALQFSTENTPGQTWTVNQPDKLREAIDAAPSSHTHAIADTTGLQTALDAKAPSGYFADGEVDKAGRLWDHQDDVVGLSIQNSMVFLSGVQFDNGQPLTGQTRNEETAKNFRAAIDAAPSVHGHSMLDVSGLNDEINRVEEAQLAGDEALQTTLSTETTERQAADTALDGKISAEASARTTAITGLQTALDSKIPYGTALGGASVPFADGALSLRNFEDPGEVALQFSTENTPGQTWTVNHPDKLREAISAQPAGSYATLVSGLVPATQLPPISYQTTRYDGDGVAFSFAPPGTLTASDSASAISVTINGVTQEPGSDYTLDIATNRVVLTSALPIGDKIVITRPLLLPSNSTLTAEQLGALTATSLIDGGSF